MGRGGKYEAYDIQCLCGATARATTLGRHKYDRKPSESLAAGWERWGWEYILCPECAQHKKLLGDLSSARTKYDIADRENSWKLKKCGDGINLWAGDTVVLRVEPKTGAVYLLSEPFAGDVEAALASEQLKVWLAENG